MKVVIILPTYNEKGNVERLIQILQKDIFPLVKNHKMSILVADDNSPDGTAEEVKKLMKKWDNIELSSGQKQGLGAAYVRGMTYAIEKMGVEIMFEMDADLSHEPNKIPQFLKKIDEGYDMAIGTRYTQGGSIPSNWPPIRKAYSIIGNLLVRTILTRFSIHDWTGGYRALKKEVFLKEKDKLTNFKGYTFQVSFLHKTLQDGFKIAEVPIHFTDRTLGRSKIAPREYIIDLLKYVISARILEILKSPFPKYFITGFTGYLINAIALEIFSRFFGFQPGVAARSGAILSVIWNFTLNNFWSFSGTKITSYKKIIMKFLLFVLISAGSVKIIETGVHLGTYFYGNTPQVRQISLFAIIGLVVIPYSYTMYNLLVWRRWRIGFLEKLLKMG